MNFEFQSKANLTLTEDFQVFAPRNIIYKDSTSLILMNTETGEKSRYFPACREIHSFLVSPLRQWVFVIERNAAPRILIYNFDFELINTLEGLMPFLIDQICYDHVSNLLVVRSEDELIWIDIERAIRLEVSLPPGLLQDFRQFSTHPRDKKKILLLSEKNVAMYTLEPSLKSQNFSEPTCFSLERVGCSTVFELTDEYNDSFCTFVWAKTDLIYIATKNSSVLLVNVINFQKVNKIKINKVPESMFLTKHALFILDQNSDFLVYELNDKLEILGDSPSSDFNVSTGKISRPIVDIHTKEMLGIVDGREVFKAKLPEDKNEDAEDDKHEHSKSIMPSRSFQLPYDTLGHYHSSPIIGFVTNRSNKEVMSFSSDGMVIFWDLAREKSLNAIKVGFDVKAFFNDELSQRVYFGCNEGVLRRFSVFEGGMKELANIKLAVKEPVIKIRVSGGCYGACVLENIKQIFLFEENEGETIEFLGCFGYDETVHDFQWAEPNKLIVLYTGLLVTFTFNKEKMETDLLKTDGFLETEAFSILARRVDIDLRQMVIDVAQNQVVCVGRDLIAKRYALPSDSLAKLDLKIRLAPPPLEEKALSSGSVSLQYVEGSLVMALKEGKVIAGSVEFRTNCEISAMHVDPERKVVLIGTDQGNVEMFIQNRLEEDQKGILEESESLSKVQCMFSDIKPYWEVFSERKMLKNREEDMAIEKILAEKLQVLVSEWQAIKDEMEEVEEDKKLDPNEFIIDEVEKEEIEKEAQAQVKKVIEESKVEEVGLKLEVEKITSHTLSTMAVGLQSLVGFKHPTIIFNFPLVKPDPKELRKLSIARLMRRMGMREKEAMGEGGAQRSYHGIINSGGPFQVYTTDYEAREADIEAYKNERRTRMDTTSTGPKKTGVESLRTRRKRRGVKQAAETHVEESQKKEVKEVEEWKLLYTFNELISEPRKRIQVLLLKSLIWKIKKDFNLEFQELSKLRLKKEEMLAEITKKIELIFQEIGESEELIEVRKNVIPNLEILTQPSPEEKELKRYLSKTERKRVEEEARLEEERQKQLSNDNTTVRALTEMMGNSLEEKKEKRTIEVVITKSVDQMTEEERVKYEEMLEAAERAKEEAEKAKKIMKQDLKKLKSEQQEIISTFDRILVITQMKRLEVEYKIYENELFLLKLNKDLYFASTGREMMVKAKEEQVRATDEYADNKQRVEILEREYHQMKAMAEAKAAELAKLENKMTKLIMPFISPPKDDAKREALLGDLLAAYRTKKGIPQVSEDDPYADFDQHFLFKINKYDLEFFKEMIISKRNIDSENEFHTFSRFFEVYTKSKKFNKLANNLRKLFDNSLVMLQSFESKLLTLRDLNVKSKKEQQLLESNLLLLIRLPYRRVELHSAKAVTLLNDAVLISSAKIHRLNEKIGEQGRLKIDRLRDNLAQKRKVESEVRELQILELEIKRALVESLLLTRLKVSKKLQTLLSQKQENVRDVEEVQIKKQIDKLHTTIDKTVDIYRKKETVMRKEINSLGYEIKRLSIEGVRLQDSVSERTKIFTMIFDQTNSSQSTETGGFKRDELAFKHAKDIAYNRKLFDTAKSIAYEIESLMHELKVYKDRTYPNLK